MKGVFRSNHCPLQANVDNHYRAKTVKIDKTILQAIYEAQDEEKKLLMDYQAFAGERIGCLSGTTGNNPSQGTSGMTLEQIEPFDDKYSIVRVLSHQTKARYEHVCVIPRPIAESVISNAKARGRTHPFPSFERHWREITDYSHQKHGVRITSHYLRKRFATIAQKTEMSVNSWDFLMGDRMTEGHEANVYTLEDWSELVKEYDQHLAPYLSISKPREPDEPTEPFQQSAPMTQLQKENSELKEQIVKLTKLLTEKLTERAY